MTRIISGFAGSRRLKVPSSGTRPSSDRVREAIFSALDASDSVADSYVLDLYAGSGALGLEAISRGAHRADLVEKNGGAAKIIRENTRMIEAAAPGKKPAITVHPVAVLSFLGSASLKWDIVFIDPPYDLNDEALAADLAALVPHLSEDAQVVLERSSRSPQPTLPEGLELRRRKDYGETTLWWLDGVPS